MTEYVKEVFEFLDRTPAAIWKLSAASLAIGGCLHAALDTGLLKPEMGGGHVREALGFAYTSGVALGLIGVVFALASLPKALGRWWTRRREAAKETGLIGDNLRYAPGSSLAILLMFLHEPKGRMPSLGEYPNLMRLVDLRLVSDENGYSNYSAGRMLAAHPHLLKMRESLIPKIEARVKQQYPSFPGIQGTNELVQHIIADERRIGSRLIV